MGRKQTLGVPAFLFGFRLLRSPDGGALNHASGDDKAAALKFTKKRDAPRDFSELKRPESRPMRPLTCRARATA